MAIPLESIKNKKFEVTEDNKIKVHGNIDITIEHDIEQLKQQKELLLKRIKEIDELLNEATRQKPAK